MFQMKQNGINCIHIGLDKLYQDRLKNKCSTYKTENTMLDTFEPIVSFVCFRSTKKNIHFFEDHPVSIPNKFGSNCLVDFREKFEM